MCREVKFLTWVKGQICENRVQAISHEPFNRFGWCLVGGYMVSGRCAEWSNFGPTSKVMGSKVKYVKIVSGPYLMNGSIDLDDACWWVHG